jgi:hypothetical protein
MALTGSGMPISHHAASSACTPMSRNAPPPASNQLVHIDWESQTDDSLMLYLAEEPQIGAEFSYNGLEWRIVDYRDGWIARLLV